MNTSVYACDTCAQGVGVHAVRKLAHSQGVSFLCDNMYKTIQHLRSYCSGAIPVAMMAFRVVLHEQEASTTDVLT